MVTNSREIQSFSLVSQNTFPTRQLRTKYNSLESKSSKFERLNSTISLVWESPVKGRPLVAWDPGKGFEGGVRNLIELHWTGHGQDAQEAEYYT